MGAIKKSTGCVQSLKAQQQQQQQAQARQEQDAKDDGTSGDDKTRRSCTLVERSEVRDRPGLHKQLRKTKFCMYHLQGVCHFGDGCAFAHSCVELQGAPDLRKTRLCKLHATGSCKAADCSFAHSEEELRSTDMFYKKTLCIWYEKGRCRNGDQCRFAHGVSELRARVAQEQAALVDVAPGLTQSAGRKGGSASKVVQAGGASKSTGNHMENGDTQPVTTAAIARAEARGADQARNGTRNGWSREHVHQRNGSDAASDGGHRKAMTPSTVASSGGTNSSGLSGISSGLGGASSIRGFMTSPSSAWTPEVEPQRRGQPAGHLGASSFRGRMTSPSSAWTPDDEPQRRGLPAGYPGGSSLGTGGGALGSTALGSSAHTQGNSSSGVLSGGTLSMLGSGTFDCSLLGSGLLGGSGASGFGASPYPSSGDGSDTRLEPMFVQPMPNPQMAQAGFFPDMPRTVPNVTVAQLGHFERQLEQLQRVATVAAAVAATAQQAVQHEAAGGCSLEAELQTLLRCERQLQQLQRQHAYAVASAAAASAASAASAATSSAAGGGAGGVAHGASGTPGLGGGGSGGSAPPAAPSAPISGSAGASVPAAGGGAAGSLGSVADAVAAISDGQPHLQADLMKLTQNILSLSLQLSRFEMQMQQRDAPGVANNNFDWPMVSAELLKQVQAMQEKKALLARSSLSGTPSLSAQALTTASLLGGTGGTGGTPALSVGSAAATAALAGGAATAPLGGSAAGVAPTVAGLSAGANDGDSLQGGGYPGLSNLMASQQAGAHGAFYNPGYHLLS